MIIHCIVLCSAYSIGKRIALDYCGDREMSATLLRERVEDILFRCGADVPISTHIIPTRSKEWQSVVESDPFFLDVQLVETFEEFVKIILEDRELQGVDVAKYILTKVDCTHLKLEKLVYLCYADYLCQEREKLFLDSIYAYRLGPVVESVYEKYKRSGSGLLAVEDDEFIYTTDERKAQAIRSRIISSKDGVKKIYSIDQTLKRYGMLSASELVKVTHSALGPWVQAGGGIHINKKMKDETILEYHCFEEI